MIWKSYHIVPKEVEDVFLVRVIKPYLQQTVWTEPSAKAFFVRFVDETGPHLRLRIKGRPSWLEDRAIPELLTFCDRKAELKEQPYMPETDRYGGPDHIVFAEEHFHLSTRMALQRISRIPYVYGDAMFDTLRMDVMLAFAAGLQADECASYFRRLRDAWLPNFLPPTDAATSSDAHKAQVISVFQEQLDPQRQTLRDTMADVLVYLKQGLFDAKQPEWEGWYRGNKMIFRHLSPVLDTVLPHLIHMHNNRMGITNYDEVYLNHILSEVV